VFNSTVPDPLHVTIEFYYEAEKCHEWKPALKIPKDIFSSLGIPPDSRAAYLRYICFAVLGAEGRLSSREIATEEPDNAALTSPNTSPTLYYHATSEGVPIDPDICGLPSATHDSQLDHRFARAIRKRDGGLCFFTGVKGVLCDAMHIVRATKGNRVRFLVHSWDTKDLI
jgi:hypothetical protein